MKFWLFLQFLSGFALLRHRVQDPLGSSYSCPATTGWRNDTVGEFFTQTRQFDESPNLLQIEVPANWAEFKCGFVNRNLTDNCNCGFVFPWDAADVRTFFFRSVPFDSQLILMDKIKTVIGVQNTSAFAQQPFNAPANMQYALLVQAGLADSLGLNPGDPLQVAFPNNSFFGAGTQVVLDDLIGMHT